MSRYLLGIDNGGTFVKAVLFDTQGNEISKAAEQVPLITPQAGFTERDMDVLWSINAKVIRESIMKAGIQASEIMGVSFSGHGKGIYLWGNDDNPAYNGILSTDGRAYKYPELFRRNGIEQKLFTKTCQKILASQPVALLKWFQENAPWVLENTRWIFGVKDYIRYKMTGEAFAELTDFSGSNLINLSTADYDNEILELLGLSEIREKLPPIKRSVDLSGYVTKQAAEETGLLEGTPCAAGLFDIDACAIAMNIVNSDNLAVIAGTWSINEYIAKKPIMDGSVMLNSLYCMDDYYLLEESSPTSAANHEWFINMFMENEKAAALEQNENIYKKADEMIEAVPPEEQDIIYLPYLFGSNYNPKAKATFVGIDSHHNKSHILRSVYEGIAFCHKVHVEKLLRSRCNGGHIRLAGGVCNAAVWVQMFADVLGLPIDIVKTKELGAFGAALTAGVACGVFSNLEDAAEKTVKIERTVYPNPDKVPVYQKKYKRYLAISEALEPFWS